MKIHALGMATVLAFAGVAHAQDTAPTKGNNAEQQAKEHITAKEPMDNMAVARNNSDDAAFDKMDTRHAGKLSKDQVSGDKWLSENFAKCDKNADGMVSQQEYAGCRAIK
jgi:hypothetical protein